MGRPTGFKLSKETLDNKVDCKICGVVLKNPNALSKHLKFQHSTKSKDYFDLYLKKQGDCICKVCGKETRFENITKGYKNTCSHECSGKFYSGDKNHFFGHKHTDETKRLLSESREGFTHTEETKKQISDSLKGIQRTPEYCQNMSEVKMGHIVSDETRAKISKAMLGKVSGFSGHNHSDKNKALFSKNQTGWWRNLTIDDLSVIKLRRKLWWKSLSSEDRLLYRHKQISFWNSFKKSDTYISWTSDRIKNSLAKVCERPNKFEQNCYKVLELEFPGKFKYVGDGSVLINYKSPDFISEEDKVIVLCHGTYFHLDINGFENTPENKLLIEKRDALPFEKAGYKVIVLWEDEV